MKTALQTSNHLPELEQSPLSDIEPGAPQSLLDLAECIEETHPTMAGRVRVRTGNRETWLPCLATVRPRIGDSLLIARLGDGALLVVGVVDGFRERLAPQAQAEHVRRIRDDEVIVIESSTGRPLVEVRAEAGRTTIRVLAATTRLEAAGKLELAGESVEVVASKGPIVLTANDDVRVTGETIHLN